MEEILLKVEHVSKNFGATQALKDVSFTIKKGTIHTLLVRNGAGKSTVVNIIAGIYKQNSGIVTLEGNDITPYSCLLYTSIVVKGLGDSGEGYSQFLGNGFNCNRFIRSGIGHKMNVLCRFICCNT